jgi:hypothetical protein
LSDDAIGSTVGNFINLDCRKQLTVSPGLTWSVVLNFEFGLLGFIWNLFFGAWNFHDFRRAEKWSLYSEQGITEHLLKVDQFLLNFYHSGFTMI